jgi:hypothetical protein
MADQVIAEMAKNPLEKLVVALREFKGHSFVDIRGNFLGDDNAWHATKRGVTVSPDLWPEFVEAIAQVADHLRAEDLPTRRKRMEVVR